MGTKKNKLNDYAATIMGLLTSLATAYAILDVDTLDFHNFKTYFKLFVIGIPAVGGWISTIKSKEEKLKDGKTE
jgi:hypothetical protein